MLCCFARLYKMRTIKKFLLFYSSLSLLFGLITLILTFYVKQTEIWNLQAHPTNYSLSQFEWMEDVAKLKNITFFLLIGFASMSIVIGLLGLLQARFKKCCLLGCLSFQSLMFTVGTTAFGVLLVMVDGYAKYHVDNHCLGVQPDNNTNIFAKTFYDMTKNLDNHPMNYVNNYMCSQQCPCTKIQMSKWSEAYQQEFNTNLNGRYRFDGSYNDFYSCYLDLIDLGTIEPLDQEELDLIKRMESRQKCSGLCEKIPFYFFKSLEEGEPNNSCQSGLKLQFDLQFGIAGISLLICALLNFLILNTQYGYWRRRMKDPEDYKSNPDRKLSYLPTDDVSVSQVQRHV